MKREEKIIIVTGGSGLLGTEFIKDLKTENNRVINFDINKETDLTKDFVNCNITSSESIDIAIKIVIDNFGRIDGLVNNAYPRTKDWGNVFEDIKLDSWRENIDMQMNSYFYITQQVVKFMKVKKSGSIVNIASIYGVVGNDFTVYEGTSITTAAAYSAIKGGLINFTRYLASYLGEFNIKVNCVSPGGIFDNQDEIFVKNYEKKVPMKRMGTPKDIAPTVTFLMSDKSSYITGQNIIVDGGWTSV